AVQAASGLDEDLVEIQGGRQVGETPRQDFEAIARARRGHNSSHFPADPLLATSRQGRDDPSPRLACPDNYFFLITAIEAPPTRAMVGLGPNRGSDSTIFKNFSPRYSTTPPT